ncbi:GmrSD restriction endonuclease domain-containing protein [Arthrobacter rhombi]|uniref:GmrSD restriction endonuclease domain-containing protein n=1 Tax=Arthrobacter rhombi TaxID=71253 RepID=UPI003FD693BE
MKATEASLLQFLKKSPQFIIPIYQRNYSWTEKECAQLWSDVMSAGKNDAENAHFVGSVVYIEKGIYQVSSQSPLLVIDGQQRLTTVTLLIEALCRHLGENEPVEGFSAKKLRNYYLLNPLEDGAKAFKLLLTQTDRDTLISLIQQRELPPEHSVRVQQNFDWFDQQIANLGTDLEALCRGLGKLMIVDVALNRDQDNPQLIFESMNSTGRELSQADLIRNFVLMGLEPHHQTELYERHWRPMELKFGQESYSSYFDAFMRHFLTVKTGEIPKLREVYDAFKNYSKGSDIAAAGVDALVKDVQLYAGHYCSMALDLEPDQALKAAFQDLRDLRVDVSYPLLLELYNDYAHQVLPRGDFLRALRLIEAYVFRRAICAIPTNSLNKTFATFGRSLEKDRYLESLESAFLLLRSYRRFPNDEEFRRELETRDMYHLPRRAYWLRRLENHDRKERVFVDEYTIEHIMPQNPVVPEEWRTELGDDWERIHEAKLHTIGNLTLTGYNSEYSDRSFQQKRDMPGGFRESPLHLNRGLAAVERWDEDQIDARAARLSSLAVSVWGYPHVAENTLDAYRPQRNEGIRPEYELRDHPNLAPGQPMRPLFDVLRTELLALDLNIREEIPKHYIAYKAETNVIDVIPLIGRLSLMLNMPFPQLLDPKGLATDVTNLGRWGNGDVEIGLSTVEEIPYVLGLVRQSLDLQLSNATETAG